MLQDPNQEFDEYLRNRSALPSTPRNEGYAVEPEFLPQKKITEDEYLQQAEDAHLYQRKLDNITYMDAYKHAMGETWVVPFLDKEDNVMDIWGSNWKKSPGFVLSEADFIELTEGLPQSTHSDILAAKSIDHAKAIRENTLNRMEQSALMNDRFGTATMMGTYIASGLLSPEGAALMFLNPAAGLYRTLGSAARFSRLGRFARIGTLGAAEGTAVVGARAYHDPLMDEHDAIFAGLISGAIGGGIASIKPTKITTDFARSTGGPHRGTTFDNVPVQGAWEQQIGFDRPPVYYEPVTIKGTKIFEELTDFRVVLYGDDLARADGILFESFDGKSMFTITKGKQVIATTPEYTISGKLSDEGLIILDESSVSFTRNYPFKKAFRGNNTTLNLERELNDVLNQTRRSKSGLFDEFTKRADDVSAQQGHPYTPPKNKQGAPIIDETLEGTMTGSRQPPPPAYRKQPNIITAAERLNEAGPKGVIYNKSGEAFLPDSLGHSYEAVAARAAAHMTPGVGTTGRFGPPDPKLDLETYIPQLEQDILESLYYIDSVQRDASFIIDNLTPQELRRLQLNGELRRLAQLDPMSISKFTRNQRRKWERILAQNEQEVFALRQAADEAHREALDADPTRQSYVGQIVTINDPVGGMVAGRIDSVDPATGLATVDTGIIDLVGRAERTTSTDARADRARRRLETQRKAGEVAGGQPTRETTETPQGEARPISSSAVERDPGAFIHPERLQYLTLDQVTPVAPSVLNQTFINTPVKLTPVEYAPLTVNQELKVYETALPVLKERLANRVGKEAIFARKRESIVAELDKVRQILRTTSEEISEVYRVGPKTDTLGRVLKKLYDKQVKKLTSHHDKVRAIRDRLQRDLRNIDEQIDNIDSQGRMVLTTEVDTVGAKRSKWTETKADNLGGRAGEYTSNMVVKTEHTIVGTEKQLGGIPPTGKIQTPLRLKVPKIDDMDTASALPEPVLHVNGMEGGTIATNPVRRFGVGVHHYLEVLRVVQKEGVGYMSDPQGFMSDGPEAGKVEGIYEFLSEYIPFELKTFYSKTAEMTEEARQQFIADHGFEPNISATREGAISKEPTYYLSSENLKQLDIDKIKGQIDDKFKNQPTYKPKQQVQKFNGVGPGGEKFTVTVRPRGVGGWQGPKLYELKAGTEAVQVRGIPRMGILLEATNKKQMEVEVREIFTDIQVEYEIVRKYHNSVNQDYIAARQEMAAESLLRQYEVVRLASALHAEMAQLGDLLNHLPEHLRPPRFQTYQEGLRKIEQELDAYSSQSTRVDPDEIELITPDGKTFDMDTVRSTAKRPTRVVKEELRTIEELGRKIDKNIKKMTELRTRIGRVQNALKPPKKVKGEKAPKSTLTPTEKKQLGAELKELKVKLKKAQERVKNYRKDLGQVEKVQAAADPFTIPPKPKGVTRTFDVETGEISLVHNKKTGTTRSIDDILEEADETLKNVRAEGVRHKNATQGSEDLGAFDDTATGMDAAGDATTAPDLSKFESAGFGLALKKGMEDMPWSGLGLKTSNNELGAVRWLSGHIAGGFHQSTPTGLVQHVTGKDVGMPVHASMSDMPALRQGIEIAREAAQNARLSQFMTEIDPIFREYVRANKFGVLDQVMMLAQEQFHVMIGRLKKEQGGPKYAELWAQIPEAQRPIFEKALKAANDHTSRELAYLQKNALGYEGVPDDISYLARRFSRSELAFVRSKDGLGMTDAQLVQVFKKGILGGNPNLSSEYAERIAKKYLERIGNNNFRGDLVNDAKMQKATAEELAEILTDNFGFTPKEARKMAEQFRVTESKATHMMFRMKLDLNAEVDFGDGIVLSLNDFMDDNVMTAFRQYARHTESKRLVEGLIADWNKQGGFAPGQFKNLDDIRESVKKTLIERKTPQSEINRTMEQVGYLIKIARDEPFSEATAAALRMQTARTASYVIKNGWTFGMSAGVEYAQAGYVHGVKGILEGIPSLKNLVNGKVEINKAELEEFAGSLGMGLPERLLPRHDLMGRLVEEGAETAALRNKSWKRFWLGSNRIVSEASGLMFMTHKGQLLSLKRSMVHYGNMMIRGEVPNTARLTDMHLTRQEWDRIGRQVREQYKVQYDADGIPTYHYDFSSWTDQYAVDLFAAAMRSEVQGLAQRSNRTNMPLSYFSSSTAHELTKIVTQYKSFSATALSNYVLRNMRAGDIRAGNVFLAAIFAGTLLHVLKASLNFEDTPDGRRRLKERMHPARIAWGAFMQSGYNFGIENIGALSGILFGVDIYGNNSRGAIQTVGKQIPFMGLLEDATGVTQSLYKYGTTGEFTQADFRRVKRLFGPLNHPFLAPFVKDLGNNLPVRSQQR